MSRELDIVPEDFSRAMAVFAHPDDLEYGAASAISRWTRSGRSVAYVTVTDGEAGIDGISPVEGGPLRQKEQVASAAVVGVDDVTFLGHPDGVVENGLVLRRDRGMTAMAGPAIGVPHAVAFGRIQLQGV